jgi:hypothetical protein
MTTMESDTAVRVVRYATTTSVAKEMREATRVLQADEVILRACGQWLDDKGEQVDLTAVAVPIKDVRSVWVEASINGRWVKLRPNNDPHLAPTEQPRIQIEARFDTKN